MIEYSFYKIFLGLILAMAIPQLIKIITEIIKHKKSEFSYFFLDGGMPSSHSSFVSALSVAIFLTNGLSPISLVTLAISSIIIRDSFGIRLEVGKQKRILEKLDPKDSRKEKLKREGHTIAQVIAGIFFGILIMLVTLAF
ncbi:divergent PAP2 family protein [Candidatus Woesearchaeota archaeon]|nr:divergent PAP2 family protein [Candidatus Woesearchaeota archaeon]